MPNPFEAELERRQSNPFEAELERRRTAPPETTPLEPPVSLPEQRKQRMEETQKTFTHPAQSLFDNVGPSVPDVVLKAAEAGVEYDNPAASGHYLSSMAYGRKDRIDAFKQSLSRIYGEEIDVRLGSKTGALEYFNPDTGRWALVNPPGLSGADIEGMTGPGMVLGAEFLGGILGAGATAGTAGTILGAGAGAALGEAGRLMLGQRLGINQSMTAEDIAKASLTEFGISAAGGVVGEKALRYMTFLIKKANGEAVPEELVANLGLSDTELRAAAELADTVNERIGEEVFRFNLAQASLDENLLVTQEYLRRSPAFSKEFGAITAQQEEAVQQFYKAIHKPYDSRIRTPAEAGQRVIDVVEEGVNIERRRLDIPVERKAAELKSALDTPSQSFESTGRNLREFRDAESVEFEKWAKDGAMNLHKLAGGKAYIENRNLHKVVRGLDVEIQEALFPSIEKPNRGLIGFEEIDQDMVNAIFDPNAKFTFRQAWNAISALKRIERAATTGLSTETPEVGAVIQLRKALEKDLRVSSQNSPLAGEYDQFITRYRQEKIRLDSGSVGDMVKLTNGSWRIADEKLFKSFFTPGTKQNAEELFNLVKDSPQMMQAVRESLVDLYKKTVVDNGRINMDRHAQFMTDHLRSANVFFTKDELKLFAKPGQIELALQAREAARKTALDRLNKTFAAEIADLNNPGKLMNLIMDPKNPDKARELASILSKTPDVLRAVQYQFRKTMLERITGPYRAPAGRSFSAANLDRFLTGKGGEGGHLAIARNLFGEQYANDLMTLNDVLRRVRAEPASGVNTSRTAFWEDTVKGLARAYVGLFTKPGRVVTAAARIKQRFAENMLYRTVADPVNLRNLMELRGEPMKSAKTRALLGSMGATFLLQDE